MPQAVFIGVGSNLGDRQAALSAAVRFLAPEVRVLKASKIYETPPWGYKDQPAFLNQVFETDTELVPAALLDYLKAIEKRLGREPTFRYGPRVIDLDILFYNSLVLSTDDLTIPHPLASERAFVLVPMCELAPDFVHPVLNLSMSALAREVDSSGIKEFKGAADGKA